MKLVDNHWIFIYMYKKVFVLFIFLLFFVQVLNKKLFKYKYLY